MKQMDSSFRADLNLVRKRWITLYVENRIGVMARIAGLFSGKSYNIDSITVGVTEDPTVSRMTIGFCSDGKTFEQAKKQLNRSVEVIKVVDITDLPTLRKELLMTKITGCGDREIDEIFRIAQVYGVKVCDYAADSAILECTQSEEQNDEIIALLCKRFPNRVEVVRGGAVAIEKARLSR